MKRLILINILIALLALSQAAFATVAYGPVLYQDGVTPPAVADMTFVSYIGGNYIITEKTTNGYSITTTNLGKWSVNSTNFIDENRTGTVAFTIKMDAQGKTKTVNGNIDTTIGTIKIPTSGNTILDQTSALAAPVLSITKGDAKLTLNWSAVSGATSYSLYRATADNGYFARISSNA